MKPSCISCLLLIAVLQTPPPVHAQPGRDYSVEIAIVPSLNVVTEVYESDMRFHETLYSRTRAYLAVPSNAPSVRLTIWAGAPVLIDAACSVVAPKDEKHEDIVMVEFGLGADLGYRDDRIRPFGGILFGHLVNEPEYVDESFVGAQAGARYFIRDYAAVRIQFAYRRTVPERDYTRHALEIAAGIGFFL